MSLRRLSLRSRLVLGLLVLAAAGLIAADVATYTSEKSFLIEQTDNTLQAEHQFAHGCQGPSGRGRPLPPDVYVEVRSLSTRKVVSRCQGAFPGARAAAPPKLPTTITLAGPTEGQPDAVRYFTAPAESGGGRYRVRASIEVDNPGQLLIVATSLRNVDATLHRLFLIELFVTLAVLAALVLLGLWVVRIGLRPLVAIEHTAAAIGDGDLSQRVERAEPRTEIGRLGLALNAMLGQIERAFNAREASEQKMRRFVADASHELRTPLAAVRAYSELFTRGAEQRPEDLARSMAGINREAQRMSTLVEDLLLLARLDEGRPLRKDPVELEEVVGEAIDAAHAVDPKRPLTFHAESVHVIGDHDRMRQIVDNLLGNARVHTPPETPVHVTVGRENGKAVIEVSDEGHGMTSEELERVFERFYRTDASRSRTSGGVGLGLSIVAAVAEAHGGSVEARSEPGSGATFRILLPLPSPTNGDSGPS